jgi:hypothetical protein
MPFVPVSPRVSLPSLDELTVLSELGLADIRVPSSARLGVATDANETRAESDARAGRGHEAAQPQPETDASATLPPRSRPPPSRWMVTLMATLVTVTGIAVGAALAWFALGPH